MTLTGPLVRRAIGVLAVAVLLMAPISAPRAEDSDPLIARVNGIDIRQSDLALAEEEIGANMPQMAPQQKREYLITYLVDVIVLGQAAEQQKLGDSPDVKRRMAFERNKVLMEVLLQKAGETALNDDELHKVYNEAVAQMGNEEEVHARQIMVLSEDEATAIVAELKNGADFITLAKEKSKEPGAAEGGDLGYFTKGEMVPEIAEAAFKLQKGQISDPVHTKFGWHIIKVEDRRIKPIPSFEEVKGQLESYVARRAQAELVNKLRTAATIERFDQPPQPPAVDPSLTPPAAKK